MAATGLLKEAQDELRGVSGGSLPKELLVDYYGQMLYLYSHFNQYTGSEWVLCMNISTVGACLRGLFEYGSYP